jgi:hypothetical protein
LNQLKHAYKASCSNSFGLFLGAGVNLFPEDWKDTKKKNFETYSWKQLLGELYVKNEYILEEIESFDNLAERYEQDWPRLATEVVKKLDINTLVSQIEETIYNNIPRKDPYGRLSKRLLNQAPTLHAAICFSARIRSKTKNSWTFERNPKIGTVITSNYDFFFGAGWTRYQSFKRQWKLQTPFSKKKPKPGQGTINYIHGYLPYKLREKRNVVLTQESYNAFYAHNGFSYNALREAVRNYNLIFLGTSFSDKPLCDMLEQYKGERQHFIIDKLGSKTIERARALGVFPVLVYKISEIGEVLKKVYISGLSQDNCEEVSVVNPVAYWKRLKEGPVKSLKEKKPQ